jgi:two-component system sensor histidine kinase DctS
MWQMPKLIDFTSSHRWRLFLPLLAITTIVAIAATLLIVSQVFERERQERRLISDSLWAEQAMGFEVQRVVEALQQMSRDATESPAGAADFRLRSLAAMQRSPEALAIEWWHTGADMRRVYPPPGDQTLTDAAPLAAQLRQAVTRAERLKQGTALFADAGGDTQVVLAVPGPVRADGGTVVLAVVSLEKLLVHTIPWWFAHETQITLDDVNGSQLAVRDVNVKGHGVYRHKIALQLLDQTLYLSTDSSLDTPLLVPNLLTLSVVCLSLLLAWTVYALWRDLAMRTKAEFALREQQAFQQAMENSLVTGLRARDMQGRVTYANPAFCEMVGYSREELIGMAPPMPYWAPEIAGKAQDRNAQRLAGTLPVQPFESVFIRRDGQRLDVFMHEAPLLDGAGRQTGWMASILDISQQKKDAEFLRQQNERMQRMSRVMTMGEMASALAHELNQPLAAVTSYISAGLNVIEAGRTDPRTAEAAGMFTKAKTHTERAGMIIRRVRQFVQKSGSVLLPTDLHEAIAEVLPLVGLQAAGTHERVLVELESPAPVVMVDRILLQQILLNLSKNAFEAMAEQQSANPSIVISARRHLPGDRAVTVSVRDHGPGLGAQSEVVMGSTFSTTKPEGMGMGLAVCRTALELMGSHLVYRDAEGGGAEFMFALQLAQPE